MTLKASVALAKSQGVESLALVGNVNRQPGLRVGRNRDSDGPLINGQDIVNWGAGNRPKSVEAFARKAAGAQIAPRPCVKDLLPGFDQLIVADRLRLFVFVLELRNRRARLGVPVFRILRLV